MKLSQLRSLDLLYLLSNIIIVWSFHELKVLLEIINDTMSSEVRSSSNEGETAENSGVERDSENAMERGAKSTERKSDIEEIEGIKEDVAEGIAQITERKSVMEGVKGDVLDEAIGEVRERAEAAAESLVEDTMDEVDIEQSQLSSGSEDEDLVKARKAALQRMQDVMTKPSEIQDPNRPRISKDADKEYMDEHASAVRDKAILQSMAVAERGYITRLRPPSAPTDKLTLSQYQIRPGLEEKFKSVVVKEMIHNVLNDELGGKIYSEEEAKEWSQSIANTIRMKVKEMGFPRYKFVVQCVIGEEHGAGVKIGSRCLWDADTDNYASDTFLNETIFCMTAVYAIYFY
ncbi:hypothetical protein R5R35_007910 [Gryllus longicercus]|uniref:Tctex1 domain-containing protein 2 n=2 Tax=Gryllus longicercus TaxID=2509291 RepID=A0AAN9V6F5_9ORTH